MDAVPDSLLNGYFDIAKPRKDTATTSTEPLTSRPSVAVAVISNPTPAPRPASLPKPRDTTPNRTVGPQRVSKHAKKKPHGIQAPVLHNQVDYDPFSSSESHDQVWNKDVNYAYMHTILYLVKKSNYEYSVNCFQHN